MCNTTGGFGDVAPAGMHAELTELPAIESSSYMLVATGQSVNCMQ